MIAKQAPRVPVGMALATVSWLVIGFLALPPVHAVVFEPLEFETPAHERRYRVMIAELRCLVCQNQNLADSDAALAGDLRAEVYRMINEGHDDDRIVAFMVQRYGDFVLYRPPWKLTTAMLWLAPIGLVLAGVALALRALRRAGSGLDERLSRDERERLDRMVETLVKRDDPQQS